MTLNQNSTPTRGCVTRDGRIECNIRHVVSYIYRVSDREENKKKKDIYKKTRKPGDFEAMSSGGIEPPPPRVQYAGSGITSRSSCIGPRRPLDQQEMGTRYELNFLRSTTSRLPRAGLKKWPGMSSLPSPLIAGPGNSPF